MEKLIECVPNFSEGRDQEIVRKIVESITSVPGIILLGNESDPNHNRSVVTFAGPPQSAVEAAFQGIKKASELINLENHKGVHPRMGATDVCPLVPLKGVSMEECIKYAEELGSRVGSELQIPVYLYENAARKPERKNLANVRRGEYEGIKAEISNNPQRKPDFGPSKMGPAGATAISAREILIAYNVNLDTSDLKIAKKIAKSIREKDGGLKHVKALGLILKDKNLAQVSMNLTNYKVTPIHTVFETIKKEAASYGVKIKESEIIGLVPEDAVKESKIENLKILERMLQNTGKGIQYN